MNIISAIIDTLSKEERIGFIQYLKYKNRRGDVKNIQLFKLIEAGETVNLDVKIYGKQAKNAYHALSKRLQDALIDFVASKSFDGEASEELEILKLLVASRVFFECGQYRVAFKTLKRAEKNALELDLYGILNEIYHTKIQYAHLDDSLVLQEVIAASNINMKFFQKEYQLNMVYASIKLGLKNTKNKTINEIVSEAFLNFDIKIDSSLTYKSLYQLMSITSTVAKEKSNYYDIVPFMIEAYDILHRKKNTADKHLFYHIHILEIMATNSFRNKEFDVSMKFVNQMELEMQKREGKYYKVFVDRLLVLKALNYNFTGIHTNAIELLQQSKGESLDIKLVLIMCLFQQNRHSEAYSKFKKLSHSDAWYFKKKGRIWVLKKNILEILILIELDKLDLVLMRLQAFKRKFEKQLVEMGEKRALNFIKMVSYYYENPKDVTSVSFKEKVEGSFDWIGPKKEDIYVMSFYAWLKAKMEQKNLYQTTLELVKMQ